MGGYLKNGDWVTADDWEHGEDGSFERQQSQFRNWVRADGSSEFPPARGRYHLVVSMACPWAHRCLLVRGLKGLEGIVSVSMTHPFMGNDGWVLGESSDDKPTPDAVLGVTHLRDLYLAVDPTFTGRVTVPVLWDRQSRRIVNNESREILRMFDVEFHALAERSISLCPNTLRDQIDRTIDAIYEPINNGVYRAGFAATQQAYEAAYEQLFSALEYWETVLGRQRFLCGNQFTEADICMFTTLIRFDPVYYSHFKCNKQRIVDYPNLSGYLREIYQMPGVSALCDFEHIKQHYYQSQPALNPKRIVPRGPDLEWLWQPHERDSNLQQAAEVQDFV